MHHHPFMSNRMKLKAFMKIVFMKLCNRFDQLSSPILLVPVNTSPQGSFSSCVSILCISFSLIVSLEMAEFLPCLSFTHFIYKNSSQTKRQKLSGLQQGMNEFADFIIIYRLCCNVTNFSSIFPSDFPSHSLQSINRNMQRKK